MTSYSKTSTDPVGAVILLFFGVLFFTWMVLTGNADDTMQRSPLPVPTTAPYEGETP